MYEIRSAGVKGLGVFAKHLIPRGTRIFSERPLLSITHDGDGAGARAVLRALTALTPAQRTAVLGLSGGAPRRDVAVLRWAQVAWYRALETLASLTSRAQGRAAGHHPSPPSQYEKPQHGAAGLSLNIAEHVRVLAIFRSNAFDIGLDRQAVFPSISRINHSCIPSAEGNFHEELGKLNVHATRDILDGEEVMINYLKETGVALREQRQAKLLEGYGFDCNCAACDAKSRRGQQGEQQREYVLSALAKYAEGARLQVTPSQGADAELAMMLAMMTLFESLGLTGKALSS